VSPFVQAKAVRHADRLLGRSVLLLLLAVYTATFTGAPDNPDAEVEFQTTSSLVRFRGLALGGTPESDALIAWNERGSGGYNVMEGVGPRAGRFYSWCGVGQAMVGVPFYLVGSALSGVLPQFEEFHRRHTRMGVPRSEYFEHLLVGWRNPLLASLTGWLVFLCARRLGARRSSAFVAALGFGLCSFMWAQARSTLSDVQATFFCLLAFHLVLRMREGFYRLREPSIVELVGFGTSLAAAFLTRAQTAPVVFVLVGLVLVVVVRGRSRIPGRRPLWLDVVLAAAPAALGLLFFFWVNQRRFGDPLETGYGAGVDETFFDYPILMGIGGLLLSPGTGILWLSPAVFLVPWGLRFARRQGHRFLGWTTVAVAAATILPTAMTQTWAGAWTFGPRYVLPLLPFLWVGVALGLDAASRVRYGRLIGWALLTWGFVVNLPAALVDHMTHQDLAMQAARIAWPDEDDKDAFTQDAERFNLIRWDLRFAAPWAHWRILRHRVAGLPEEFAVEEIFFLPEDDFVQPAHDRDRGFRHLAWVDFHQRLGGAVWPAVVLCLVLLGGGVVAAVKGFDPALE